MSPEPNPPNPVQFAAFKLRFRALRIDGTICLALFVIGGIVAGILLENRVGGRVAAFAVIIAAILTYEPWMVARYGGTFGHQRSNIRIVCKESGENLPIWRAAVRSLAKQLFGLPSFAFMFVTGNAQALHDLLAGSRVIIRDPVNAAEDDRFDPTPPVAGQPLAWTRRILVVLACNVALVMAYGVLIYLLGSPACLEQQECTASENLAMSIAGSVWFILAGIVTVLGLTGRLPGCCPSQPVVL